MTSIKNTFNKLVAVLSDLGWIEWAIFFILLAIYSVTLIGDHGVRLAHVHTDNGLVAHSLIARFPERFAQDEMSYYSPYMIRGTICFWLPVWLSQHWGFSAPLMDLVLHHLQNILMGFSIFIWSFFLTQKKILSYASTFTALAVLPWGWNLASYAAIMYMTFYTTLAIAIVPVIFCAIGRNTSIKIWMSLLILLCLVHPAVALYVIGALGVFFLWEPSRRNIPNFLIIGFGFLICVLPSLFNVASIPDPISHADHWAVAQKHMHFFPWSQYPVVWDAVLPSFIAFLIYAAWAYMQGLSKFSKSTQRLLISLVVSTCVFAIIHFIGIGLQSIAILQVTGLRAGALLVIIFWPVVVAAIWHRIEVWRPSSYLAVFCFLVMLGAGFGGFGPGFFWSGVLLWLVFECLQFAVPKSIWVQLLAVVISTTFMILEIRYFRLHNEFDFAWSVSIIKYFVDWGFALTFVLAIVAIKPKIFRLSQLGLACAAIAFALYRSTLFGSETRLPFMYDLYTAQVWARDHTPVTSRFITEENWRTVSERAKVNAIALVNTKIYAPTQRLKEIDDYFIKLHGLQDRFAQLKTYEISMLQDKSFSSFTTAQVREIQARWGGDYVVRRNDMNPLNLPEAYRNTTYVIYQLN